MLKLSLFSLFSVHCLCSDPNALSYINITREEHIYVYMDGNKINIINLMFSVCCLLSKDVDTRGRSWPSVAAKLAEALCCLMAVTIRKDLLHQVFFAIIL